MGGTYYGHYAMSDAARRLRAQKAYSTDPAYLERMAREEETRRVDPTNDLAAEGGSAFARRDANVIGEMGAMYLGLASETDAVSQLVVAADQ